ncbi:MAG: alpha/beta hydrolase [Acidobacteriota bacterium]
MRSSPIGMLLRCVRLALAIGWQRLRGIRHGPRDLRAAVLSRLLRRDIREVVERGIPRLRASELATPVWPSVKRQVAFERGDVGGVPGLWITPRDPAPDAASGASPTLVYFHGGGYCFCSSATHRAMVAQIALAGGCRSFVPDYRLAPEHPHPAAIEDALAVVRGLMASGISADELVIGGDSAGGGLSLATLVALREAGDPLPRAAVLLSPWVDLACTGASIVRNAQHDYLTREILDHFAQCYLGETNPLAPSASPLYADLHGLPPLLIQVGALETLLSESRRLAEHAAAAGVTVELQELEDAVHVSQAFAPMVPAASRAIQDIGRFIGRSFTPSTPSARP